MRIDTRYFNFYREVQRWRGQYVKLVVLIFSYALVCALLAVTLRLGDVLFKDLPGWIEVDNYVYSVVRRHNDGAVSGIEKNAINTLSTASQITKTSWIWPRSMELTKPNGQVGNLSVLVFSQTFFENLAPSLISEVQGEGIWLSHHFWQKNFSDHVSVDGLFFVHDRVEFPIPIRGVLPSKFDAVGPWKPDIWLSENYLAYSTPFSSENTQLVDRFLNAVPEYYGIIQAASAVEPLALVNWLNDSDLMVGGIVMQEDGAEYAIYKNINFDPLAKSALVEQWTLIIILLVLFGMLVVINSIIIFSAQSLDSQAEYRLMRILGAKESLIFNTRFVFALVNALIVGVISLIFLEILSEIFNATPVFSSYMNGNELSASFTDWGAAWLVTTGLLLTTTFIPLVKQRNDSLFKRQAVTGKSIVRKVSEFIMLTAQMAIVLFAIELCFHIVWDQVKREQTHVLKSNVNTIKVNKFGSPISIASLRNANKNFGTNGSLAFSATEFTNTHSVLTENSVRIENNVAKYEMPIQVWAVSDNFFQVLDVPLLGLNERWRNGVVINATAAKLLSGDNNDLLNTIGQEIDLGVIYGVQRIVGIAPDIPHQGRSAAPRPSVYTLLVNPVNQFVIYHQNSNATHSDVMLWLNNHVANIETERAALQTLIDEQDKVAYFLMYFTLAVSLILVGSVVVGLVYQIRADLNSSKWEFATLVAIGAPDSWIFGRSSAHLILAIIVAIPISLILLVNYQMILTSLQINMPQINVTLLLSSVLMTGAIVSWVMYLQLRKLVLRASFADLR